MKSQEKGKAPDDKALLRDESLRYDSDRRRRDPIFLLTAIHAFLVSFPTLIISLLGTLAYNEQYKAFVGDESFLALTSPGSPAKNCNEIMSWSIVCFSIGYYMLYRDGPKRQPLILGMGALGKLGACCMMIRWYVDDQINFTFVLFATIPDFTLGMYLLYAWYQINFTMTPILLIGDKKEQ